MSAENLVQKQVIEYYDCVIFDINQATNDVYRVTNAPRPITIDGIGEFTAAGGLLSIDNYDDNANFSIDKLTIKIGGIVEIKDDEPFMRTLLSLNYTDRPVTIYRVFFTNHKVDDYIVLYKGYIDSATAVYNAVNESTVDVITSSHWTNFDRESSRYTNSNSQQSFYPNDQGFYFATEVQKEVIWREE